MKQILPFLKGLNSLVSITFILSVLFLKYFNTIVKQFDFSTETYEIMTYATIAILGIISIFMIRDIYILIRKIANK
jgi:hypothetical protein